MLRLMLLFRLIKVHTCIQHPQWRKKKKKHSEDLCAAYCTYTAGKPEGRTGSPAQAQEVQAHQKFVLCCKANPGRRSLELARQITEVLFFLAWLKLVSGKDRMAKAI